MNDSARLREMEDRFLLPYRHRTVTQVRVDYALTLLFDGDASVSVEQPATLSAGYVHAPTVEKHELLPDVQEVAAALRLIGKQVLSSVAFKSGDLRLTFDDGTHLNVPTCDAFEAWSARGPGTLLVVSQPGGGLAVWR